MRTTLGTIGLLLTTIAAGCASGQGVAGRVDTANGTAPRASASCNRTSIAKPVGQPRTGATIALAKVGSKRIAFVADEDARAVTAIDVEAKKELASTPLPGIPSQLMVASDGRVLVLLRDRAELHVLAAENESGALAASCAVPTAPEPVGLAASPDDKTLLVSSGWGRTLRAFDGASLDHLYDVALAREPRAVVVSDDGATAYVSHAVGSTISAVDLKAKSHTTRAVAMRGGEGNLVQSVRTQRKSIDTQLKDKTLSKASITALTEAKRRLDRSERVGCQGFALAKSVQPAGRILAPQVLVDPGDPEGRPEGYGNNDTETEVPSVAVIDEGAASAFDDSLTLNRNSRFFGSREARDHRAECLLPRAAAVDPRSHTLFVACFGIDSVIAYDSASANPQNSERRRWVVGAGPSGIAVDPETPRAFVWSQFDRSMSVLPLNAPELVEDADAPRANLAKVTLAPMANKLATDIALGRMIFHSGGDTRISKDGRACASCHPDGRDDALTWATPEGPRRTILLAGRVAKTSAYAWDGSTKSLHEHITKTFDRLNGTGLRSLELDALVTYISTMRPPVPAQDARSNDPKVARGAAIFASKEAACSSCHVGTHGFEDGLTHDVKSKTKGDRGVRFDTPSLKFISGTGPYFHDGRYPDLKTLLRDVDGKMGHTKQLSEADLDALETYLRTL